LVLGSLLGFIFRFLVLFFVVVGVWFCGSPTALKCFSVGGFREKGKKKKKQAQSLDSKWFGEKNKIVENFFYLSRFEAQKIDKND
jgi:hypothetical protein